MGDVAVLPSHLSSAQHDNNGRVAVNSVASRCHRREQQLLRAPPGRAQHLGSLDRDTFSHDVALYLEEEGAERGRRVARVKEPLVGSAGDDLELRVFTQVDGSHEGSASVVVPHAVERACKRLRAKRFHTPRQTVPPLGSTFGL